VDHLKLLKTFNMPWQWSAGKRVVEGSDLWQASESASIAYDEALTVGSEWLGLAAAVDRLAILHRRQEQLTRALSIQEKRFELGEVSGSELTQLRLAKVGESALLREHEVQVRRIVGRLRERVESDEFDAGVGDLEALMQLEVAELPSEDSLDSLVETSPAVLSAKHRADLEEATSRLVRHVSWGRPALEAEWQRVPDMGGIEGFDALGLQVAVPLPLGKSVERTVAVAEARSTMASQKVELVRRQVKSWLQNELATGRSAAQTLAELVPELDGLPRTRESLTQQFALGAISYLVYLDGQERLDEIELQGVEARRALLRSRLSLALMLEQNSFFPIPSFNSEVEP
jgi:outer membrane protein TolC